MGSRWSKCAADDWGDFDPNDPPPAVPCRFCRCFFAGGSRGEYASDLVRLNLSAREVRKVRQIWENLKKLNDQQLARRVFQLIFDKCPDIKHAFNLAHLSNEEAIKDQRMQHHFLIFQDTLEMIVNSLSSENDHLNSLLIAFGSQHSYFTRRNFSHTYWRVFANGKAGDHPVHVSFAGCGFLGIYHIGVASALKEYAPQLVMGKVSGASAGAIAACGLVCNMCLGQATSDVLKIVVEARSKTLNALHPSFKLMNILRQGLRRTLPYDAHKLASGRLIVSLTRCSDYKNVRVSQFDTKEELIQVLICSSFIPGYCGIVRPTYKGVSYMDGGFSDNQPILDDDTVTVSPFSGESDICPLDSDSQSFLSFDLNNTNIRLTSRNFSRFFLALIAPHPEVMSQMCREGFEDTLRFLALHNLISCARCLEVRSVIVLDRTAFDCPPDSGPVDCVKRVTFEVEDTSTSAKLVEAPREDPCREKLQCTKSSGKLPSAEAKCQSCEVTRNVASERGLPVAVKQTLAEGIANQRTFFSYVMEFRLVKWMRFMAIPWILPWDLAYAFFMRLTCRMSITDLNYSTVPSVPEVQALLTSCEPTVRPMSLDLSHQTCVKSSLHSLSGGRVTGGQCSTTNLNFGFSVDLPPSNASSQVSRIVSRDDATKREFYASDVTNAAEHLQLEGLRHAAVLGSAAGGQCDSQSCPDSLIMAQEPLQENFDAYSNIINFSHKRDALLAFYYLDEQNRIKMTKILGCEQKSCKTCDADFAEPAKSTACGPSKQLGAPERAPEKTPRQPRLPPSGLERAVAVVAPFLQKVDQRVSASRRAAPAVCSPKPSFLDKLRRSKPVSSSLTSAHVLQDGPESREEGSSEPSRLSSRHPSRDLGSRRDNAFDAQDSNG